MASPFSLNDVFRKRYRPTVEVNEFLESLRRGFGLNEKYVAARLAIARSLVEPGEPPLLERGTEFGSAMLGDHLFGEHGAVWATLLAEGSGRVLSTIDELRDLVEAHWHRGGLLLQADYEGQEGRDRDVEFAVRLAGLAGAPRSDQAHKGVGSGRVVSSARLEVRIGEVGIEQRSNVPVDVELNAPGISPHIALMGKARSGKTRTGLAMAQRIAAAASVPILIIDPKGEFVRDGGFVKKSEWQGQTLADRFPGVEPIDVPNQPVPLDFLALPAGAKESAIAQAASAFRDSFKNCVRVKGDIAMGGLRETVEQLMRARQVAKAAGSAPPAISLEDIRQAVHERNQQQGGKKDSIEAQLEEITSLRLFDPSMSPESFFRKRWAVGLSSARDESKRLVTFLLLDALAAHVLSSEDAPTDPAGYRASRHLLIIDEAKEILAYRHGALSDLLRKAPAKGEIVMLLSQSPSDFDQEADDFLSQMGTIVVFSSITTSVANLRAALGKRVTPEEFSDANLPKGVALTKVPGRDPLRVLAWK